MKIYMSKVSGNAYKVTLLCSLLSVKYEPVFIDLGAGEHKQEAFLRLNPRGQLPVVADEGRVIWDSSACLVYVARKYGTAAWLPNDAADLAEVMQWLSVASIEIFFGLQYARGILRKALEGNYEERAALGREGLQVLESRLKNNDWLALGRPTIADVACYPYVMRAPEGQIPLDPYPGIRAWLARFEALPGYFKL